MNSVVIRDVEASNYSKQPREALMSSNIIYTHLHHIIPKHQLGTCPLLVLIINDKSNLIELTVPEHAEAHRLLYEKFGNEYDRIASLAISGQIGKEEIIRLVCIENGKKSRGKKVTEESKRKMSLAKTGKKHTEESKRKMSLVQMGRKHTEETKKKMSLAMTGRKMPPHTEETKKKMSLARKGKKFTEEHKKNLSLGAKGRKMPPRTEETRRKISLARKGEKKPTSPCPHCGMLFATMHMGRHLSRKVSCYNKWNFTECL